MKKKFNLNRVILLLGVLVMLGSPVSPVFTGTGWAQDNEAGTIRNAHFIGRYTLIKDSINYVNVLLPDGRKLAGRYSLIKITKLDTCPTALDSMIVMNKTKWGDSVYVSVIGKKRVDADFLTAKTGFSYDLVFDPFIWNLYIKFGDAVSTTLKTKTKVIITIEAVEK